MENQKFMREGIDGKRIFLLYGKKVWIIAVAGIAGALLGAGIYLLGHLLLASEKEYETVSKIYLNFNCSPQDFNELSYNGYTWNDLMATDPILEYTMGNLPPDVDKETVIGATKAEILSDIRLLTVTITADKPELAAQIMEATQKALVHLGETDELFESIEIYSTVPPQQIVWDNRVVQAGMTGMVIAFAAAALAAAFYYVLDDSVYTAQDVEKRYGIEAVGVLTEEGKGISKEYEEEFLVNYAYLGRGMETAALISVDSKESAKRAGEKIRRLLEERDADWENGAKACQGRKAVFPRLIDDMPEEGMEMYARLREADGVLVAVRFGAGNGKRVERLLGNLRRQDCNIIGAVIVEADGRFLGRYYMGRDAS